MICLANTMSDPWTALMGNLGGMAIVGAGFILMLKHLLNQQGKTSNEITQAIHTNSLLLLQLQKELLRHDATVRGLNPSVGKDQDERVNQALEIYENIQQEIERTATVIKRRMRYRDEDD